MINITELSFWTFKYLREGSTSNLHLILVIFHFYLKIELKYSSYTLSENVAKYGDQWDKIVHWFCRIVVKLRYLDFEYGISCVNVTSQTPLKRSIYILRHFYHDQEVSAVTEIVSSHREGSHFFCLNFNSFSYRFICGSGSLGKMFIIEEDSANVDVDET